MSTESLDGRFTVKGPLRCAGVGSLMCAEDQDGARTAIRLIPQVAQGKEAVAAALRMPLHPVLPRALGSGAVNDSAWVALDFPEGELLTNRIPLPIPTLLTMSSMVAGALAALHQNDIVHGELSSESVLVVPATGGERFVLFDAPLVVMNRLTDRRGEERLLSQLTQLVPFLSPERARGGPASQASDVWALGMIISIASGANSVPGDSTLERIAAIVTNKWRPAVSGSLPVALRLLLTRMLAPIPTDRPSSLDLALELENVCVAFAAHQASMPHHAKPILTPLPMAQFRIDKLVEQTKNDDPFEALVAGGVTVNGPDVHAQQTREIFALTQDLRAGHTEPTRLIGIPLTADLRASTDVTDPNATVQVAPSEPLWESWPPAPVQPEAVVVAPIQLNVPAPVSDSPLRTPPLVELPAIAPAPMPRLVAEVAPQPQVALGQTMLFGTLPAADRPPKGATAVTEDVSEQAAAARAQPVLAAPVAPATRSVHDEAEDAFAEEVRRGQQRRFKVAAITAGVILLGIAGLIFKGQSSSEPPALKTEPTAQPASVKAEPAKPIPVPVPAEPVLKAEQPKAEPVVKAEPVKAEPAKAEPAKPAPKTEPVVNAEPVKAEPVKAEPSKGAIVAPPRPPKVRKPPVEEAPRRPASRLDEGD